MIVLARRLYAFPGRNLGIEDVVPLRFQGLAECRRWVDLRATGSNEVHITANRPRQAEVEDLTAADSTSSPNRPMACSFATTAAQSDLRLSLENRRPPYSATIRVEAAVAGDTLAENYTFACVPAKAAPSIASSCVLLFVARVR